MTETKNKGGRPTKYTEELCKLVDQYIDDFESTGQIFPSRVGLCRWLGIHKSTLYDWEKNNSEFSDSLKYIDTLSEFKAWEGGLSGDYNPTIAKLALANHGYTDKVSQDHTSSDGSMKQPTRIELVAKINDDS